MADRGVVPAWPWVGQILLLINGTKLRVFVSVPLSDDLRDTRQLAEATADLS